MTFLSSYEEILNNMPTAYFILDKDYHIQLINNQGIDFIINAVGVKYQSKMSLLKLFGNKDQLEKITIELNKVLLGGSFTTEHQIKKTWYELSASPYKCSDGYINGIVIAAQPIEKRKRQELEIRHRLDFELLISLISSKFVHLESISHSIDFALEMIGRFSNSDRAYIFEFNEDQSTMTNTFEWCDTGVIPAIDQLQELPTTTLPWWMSQLIDYQIIQIPDVNKMCKEASREKEILTMQNIRSVLVLPLHIKSKLIGFIGLDNVASESIINNNSIHMLRVVGEIFSNAFVRLFSDRHLISTNQQLRSALDQLEIAQSQVVQQEKMVAIGQLAAGVAHEINNPMAYVMNNISVLKDNVSVYIELIRQYQAFVRHAEVRQYPSLSKRVKKIHLLEKQAYLEEIIEDNHELIQEVNEGHERIAEIVKSLRSFSHIDIYDEHQLHDINACVQTTLTVANNKLKYNVDIDKSLNDLPLVECNPGEINQVLLNVVLNSHYAMEKHAEIKRGRLEIKTFTDERYVYIELSDNGIGIPSNIQDKIFNPFFTTKPIGEGTGLGMSIAYDIIVNKHKGDISLKSELNIGTTFTIKLPIKKMMG